MNSKHFLQINSEVAREKICILLFMKFHCDEKHISQEFYKFLNAEEVGIETQNVFPNWDSRFVEADCCVTSK